MQVGHLVVAADADALIFCGGAPPPSVRECAFPDPDVDGRPPALVPESFSLGAGAACVVNGTPTTVFAALGAPCGRHHPKPCVLSP